MKSVTIRELIKNIHLKPIHGEEYLDRPIVTSEISRPGLELAGFLNFYPVIRSYRNFFCCDNG